MNEAIKELRKFFKSELWTKACFEDQPIVSDQGIVSTTSGDITVDLDTKINLALDFEGKFNEMAHEYMQWRKKMGLNPNE